MGRTRRMVFTPALAAALAASLSAPALAQDGALRQLRQDMSLAEFQAAVAGRLMRADADGNGSISSTEWSAAPRPRAIGRADPAALFARLDGDGDGALERGEIEALLARRFARLDADGDGTLTEAERRAERGRADD